MSWILSVHVMCSPQDSRSVRRKLLWSWNSGKLSHESTGWTCRAPSMSARYSDRNVSACSAISSGHHEKA